MVDQPRDPYAIATSILDGVVTCFADANVTLPARQVVLGGGLPAWDTEQLTVSLGPSGITAGMPGVTQGQPVPWQHGMFTAQFLVQLVRQATATLANSPRKQMPSAAQLAADGQTYMRDARLLAGALHTWHKTQRQGTVHVGPVIPPEQQGEMLGLSALVDVLLA